MTISIKDLRELAEKYRCGVECSDCQFLKDCKHLDEENFKYLPQFSCLMQKTDNKEVPIEASEFVILPNLKIGSEKIRKKLFDLLIAINHFNFYSQKCTVETLATYLGVSIKHIRKRLDYLLSKEILTINQDGKWTILQFFDKKDEKNIRQKELLAIYNEYFQTKFHNKPYLETIDFSVAKNFIKKNDYTLDQLRLLVREYFALNNKFLKDNGYKLRHFPAHINSILVAKPEVMGMNKMSEKHALSKEQLDSYLEGKNKGQWNGTEDWAKIYEEALIKEQVPANG